MKNAVVSAGVCLGLLASGQVLAVGEEAMISSALSGGPPAVTAKATIKTPDGKVLRAGTNGYTCYPQQATMPPMCNEATWDRLFNAMMNKQPFKADKFSLSYMMVGDGISGGVSNSDPYITDKNKARDWVESGPHLMLVVPDKSVLEGLSDDPQQPVYVMWKNTPYAHVMIKIADK